MTNAAFANTIGPDETAHDEPSYLDLQCLPSSLLFFNTTQSLLKVFRNFADVILSSAFLTLYELKQLQRTLFLWSSFLGFVQYF